MSLNPRLFAVGGRDQRLIEAVQDLRRELNHIKSQANNTSWFIGTATFTGNGTGAVNFNITHGLGHAPNIFLTTARNWAGYCAIYDAQTISAANDIGMQAVTTTGVFASGATYTVNWLASVPATSA